MSDITIDELEERGFILDDNCIGNFYDLALKDKKLCVNVRTNDVFFEHEVDEHHKIDFDVPNCKTLEDLDSLINLFK